MNRIVGHEIEIRYSSGSYTADSCRVIMARQKRRDPVSADTISFRKSS